jgi:hypothetical protein
MQKGEEEGRGNTLVSRRRLLRWLVYYYFKVFFFFPFLSRVWPIKDLIDFEWKVLFLWLQYCFKG